MFERVQRILIRVAAVAMLVPWVNSAAIYQNIWQLVLGVVTAAAAAFTTWLFLEVLYTVWLRASRRQWGTFKAALMVAGLIGLMPVGVKLINHYTYGRWLEAGLDPAVLGRWDNQWLAIMMGGVIAAIVVAVVSALLLETNWRRFRRVS